MPAFHHAPAGLASSCSAQRARSGFSTKRWTRSRLGRRRAPIARRRCSRSPSPGRSRGDAQRDAAMPSAAARRRAGRARRGTPPRRRCSGRPAARPSRRRRALDGQRGERDGRGRVAAERLADEVPAVELGRLLGHQRQVALIGDDVRRRRRRSAARCAPTVSWNRLWSPSSGRNGLGRARSAERPEPRSTAAGKDDGVAAVDRLPSVTRRPRRPARAGARRRRRPAPRRGRCAPRAGRGRAGRNGRTPRSAHRSAGAGRACR